MKVSFLVPLALFAALAGLLYAGLERNPGVVSSPLVGRPLPAFALPGVQRGELRSDALGDSPSLLNVWASWCVACRAEHPLLLRLARSGEAPIYGLNYKDEREDAVQWLNRFGDPYRRSGHDRDGKVGLDLGVYGVPETFVIDREGRIAHKHVGPIAEEDWEETIRPLLRRICSARRRASRETARPASASVRWPESIDAGSTPRGRIGDRSRRPAWRTCRICPARILSYVFQIVIRFLGLIWRRPVGGNPG